MKLRISMFFILLLAMAGASQAQSTTVSGTITDANGQAFANGTYRISFNPNGVAPPFQWNGAPFTPGNFVFTGSLNSSGAFSGVSVPSNTSIAPSTLWTFQVCPAATAPCYSQSLTVAGATMSVSTLLTPPAIIVPANSYNQPTAYSDAEIVGPIVGFQYFNLTSQLMRICTVAIPCTWVNGGSGGGSGTVTSVSCVTGCTVANPTTTPAITVTSSGTVDNTPIHAPVVGAGPGTTNVVGPSANCTVPSTNGDYDIIYAITTNSAVDPSCPQEGLAGTPGLTGATATYTIAYSDNLQIVSHDVAGTSAIAVTLPTPTTLGNPQFATSYCNYSAFYDTLTPATWTINGNASITVPPKSCHRISVDPNNTALSTTNWLSISEGPGTSPITPKVVNGISYSARYTGATAADRIISCLTDAKNLTNGNTTYICDASGEIGAQTIDNQIEVFTNTTLILPNFAVWTNSQTAGTAAMIKQDFASVIQPAAGATPINEMQLRNVINNGITHIYTTDGQANGYYRAAGFIAYQPSGCSAGGSIFNITTGVDTSLWQNIQLADYCPTDTIWTINSQAVGSNPICCTATFDHIVANGNYLSGPILSMVGGTAIAFMNVSLDHAAPGQPNFTCTTTSANNTPEDTFVNLYEETDGGATIVNQVTGCIINVFGDTVSPQKVNVPTGNAVWSVAQFSGGGGGLNINGLMLASGYSLPATAISDSTAECATAPGTPCTFLADSIPFDGNQTAYLPHWSSGTNGFYTVSATNIALTSATANQPVCTSVTLFLANCGNQNNGANASLSNLVNGVAYSGNSAYLAPGASTATSFTTAAFTGPNTAGNTILVRMQYEGGAASDFSSCTDSNGDTFSLAAQAVNAAANLWVGIAYAPITVAGATGNQVTCSWTSSHHFVGIYAEEWSGIAATSPLDTTATANNTPVSSISTSITTANPNELIIAGTSLFNPTTGVTVGSGFSINSGTNPTAALATMGAEYRVATTATAYTAALSWTGGTNAALIMAAAFKPALVAVNSSLLPGTSNSINLGSASDYWASIFGGTIDAVTGFQVGGAALNFSNLAGTVTVPSQLPEATSSVFGAVKCDGTTITCASGVISASGGGGANTTLSNLGTTAINAALLPGTTNSVALGSSSFYWVNLFSTAMQCGIAGTTSCVITGAGLTSGTATITWPAVAGTAANPITFSNGITTATSGPIESGGGLGFSSHTQFLSSGNGFLAIEPFGGGAMTRISVGADTTSNPGFCPSGTTLQIMVAGSCTTLAPLAASIFESGAAQTTVSCSTSGTAIFSQPEQGASDKKVLIHMAACLGTASYTYATAFTNTPSVYASNNVAASIATSVSTTAVTVTGATTTGSLILEDY
jgi:hypothetical protein